MSRTIGVGTALCLALASGAWGGERYALVIGINGYEHLGKLTTCVADAEALAKVLVQRAGFASDHVVVLADRPGNSRGRPTIGNVRHRIRQLTQLAEKGDTLLIFFSGHGTRRDGDGYLIPIDGSLQEGIPLSWVKEQLGTCTASSRLLILDACHAGSGMKGVGGIGPSLIRSVTLLLSCTADQVSFPDRSVGQSVFSRFLVQGLSGRADADADKQITVGELFAYVKGEMKTWCLRSGKTQVPVLHGIKPEALPIARVVEAPTPVPEPARPTLQVYTRWPFDAAEARRRQEETAKALGVKTEDELDLGRGERMNLVLIPAGEFMMGDTQTPEEVDKRWPGGQIEWYKWAHPRHRVKLSKPFYIGECEVTRGQFDAFVRETDYKTDAEKAGKAWVLKDGKWGTQDGFSWRNPNFQQTDRHPAVCISWNDAVAFCEWASRKTGKTVTLPTEAQWEYACRAGSPGIWPWGDREQDAQGKANVAGEGEELNWTQKFKGVRDGHTYTAPAGSFAANAFGLKDTIGNAWEWCFDWFGEKYYDESPASDPRGPGDGRFRVLRGGSWAGYPGFSRAACRYWDEPPDTYSRSGFRVVVFPRTF